jgi:hypothetical protein
MGTIISKGGPLTFFSANGGKSTAISLGTSAAPVIGINTERQGIMFHNPGTSTAYVAPTTTATGAPLLPTLSALAGCFQIPAGATLVLMGEMQCAWQGFSASMGNPLFLNRTSEQTRRIEMASYFTGHQPGGGLKSRNVVETPVRVGTGSHNARPAGAAQLGQAWGDHVTNRPGSTGYVGEKLHGPDSRNFQMTKFGNEVALNVGEGGCGTGRTLYGKSGSQGQHGPVAGSSRPPGRGIINNE